jgi:hypothetical protein
MFPKSPPSVHGRTRRNSELFRRTTSIISIARESGIHRTATLMISQDGSQSYFAEPGGFEPSVFLIENQAS